MRISPTIKLVSIWVAVCMLQGCVGDSSDDTSSRAQLEQLAGGLRETLDKTMEQVSNLTPSSNDIQNLTTDEINKLNSIEYRVIELTKSISSAELETELSSLGRDGWECFEIEYREEQYRIFCRRRSQTYLRYIPRFFP